MDERQGKSARDALEYGGWISTPSVDHLEALAPLVDFVAIDTQHSTISEADAQLLLSHLRRYDTRAAVRVAANDRTRIGRMLDSGADTIIVPVVETVGQARAAVAACHYPPRGVRSYGPIRPDLDGLSVAQLSDGIRCFVQIETAEGLANAEEIISTGGIDGIYVGPSDLSLALGLDPIEGYTSTQLEEQFVALRGMCDRHGVVLGTHALDLASVRQFVAWGATFLPAVNDVHIMQSATRAVMVALRGADVSAAGPGASY